jgi:predicted nucleotide-binding protein (sugar kinase/HSP70/actin superfamily)
MEIRKGQQVLFVPCISKIRRISKGAAAESLTALFESLKEVVEVMIPDHRSGNAKVRDRNNVVFYCNPNDLLPIDP